ATDFFLRDAHGIARRLKDAGEGEYAVDAARSAIYAPRTRAFPDNSEIEAIVTFTGEPEGEILPSLVPDPTGITVHLHHSLVRLPQDGYRPLPYDPRAGLIGLGYATDGFLDYAAAVGDPLRVQFARRHRLDKKDPAAEVSEAVEPIVYYVDRGAPEPVRAALIEGASWWNQAFEAAGYRNAFRVELLPPGADPMDVRYNVIQWVHRSTRGWSYGSSVLDPRTGEIIKGHVTLGSLRVRQDYLIAEGLLAPYADDGVPEAMMDMALARIRQLAAHEVGHTLGFEHNFAASTEGRSSVMDYPFPLIRFDAEGGLDLSDAYDTGIGEWDKRLVLYGYQDFADTVDATAAREAIIRETIAQFSYVADQDSRGVGTAHPDGNLWDNGADAIAELEHLLRVRSYALEHFSSATIRVGRPLAAVEDVLVPIYLLHRYQLQAVGKLLGGQYFTYALKGDGQTAVRPVDGDRQRAALGALLATFEPALLRLPDGLLELLPARPPGHARTRESFPAATGITFDPLGPARSAMALTLEVLLEPSRAARMVAGHARDTSQPGFGELCDALLNATWYADRARGLEAEIQRAGNMLALEGLMRLATDEAAADQVRAIALDTVDVLDEWLAARTFAGDAWRAHYRLARARIARMHDDPASVRALPAVPIPPGSPIGDGRASF
ncbi:MAG TPA: zinc-dependent metalloprotease, partial [Woeseiaceae bacterium]|nr:zinc-dependent metalloprotease [Woeseiaceae bacterium]